MKDLADAAAKGVDLAASLGVDGGTGCRVLATPKRVDLATVLGSPAVPIRIDLTARLTPNQAQRTP